MAISSELMYAILAMDSYNRGYNPGIQLDGTQLGHATIGVDSAVLNVDPNDPNRVDQAAGFYAVSYEWYGETIISYRGTETFAGFRPGGRGSFVSAKEPKTILALSWPFGFPARFADSGGAQTRCTQTVRACSPESTARLGDAKGRYATLINAGPSVQIWTSAEHHR